ncbi:MAG: hypothetical protein KF686_01280 [Ramlibacter sp.]|nr:hypothetical protein [Ramlibacter sp.]
MGWLLSGISGFQDWFASRPAAVSQGSIDMAAIRQAMLSPLGEAGDPGGRLLAQRIHHAPDLESLWYLRCPLMDALCRCHGEPRAQAELAQITPLFGSAHPGRSPAGTRTPPLSATVMRP